MVDFNKLKAKTTAKKGASKEPADR